VRENTNPKLRVGEAVCPNCASGLLCLFGTVSATVCLLSRQTADRGTYCRRPYTKHRL